MLFHDFKGRMALVAGGTGALGRAISLAFLDAGARVVVTYRSREEFDELSEIDAKRADGAGALIGVAADATDPASVAAVIQLQERFDILVNAVGGYSGGKNLWEESEESYARMTALNLKSGFVLARAVIPAMIRQNQGWIVNVASRAAYGHSPGAALYAASKAGALALFDSLAEELKGYNINVNSVVPSIIDTLANRRAMASADFGRWPKPAEIARVVLFLCSEDARVIRGAAIPVYGRT